MQNSVQAYDKKLKFIIAGLLIFVLVIILFIAVAENGKKEAVQLQVDITAQAATSVYKTLSAPTPIPTDTLTPLPSPLPTSTETLTPLPSLTSTKEVAPCVVTLNVLSPFIYKYPSTDEKIGIQLNKPAEVRLYYKLDDEPWWRASRINASVSEGWIYNEDISRTSCSDSLPQDGGLENLLVDTSAHVIYQDNFANFTSNWEIGENGSPLQQQDDTQGYQLVFPGLQLQIANLVTQTIPEKSTVLLAFRRIAQNKDSFTAIRLRSDKVQNTDTYLELQIFADCRYQYLYYLDGSLKKASSINSIEKTSCAQNEPSLLLFHAEFDPTGGNMNISGQFAGFNLANFSIIDARQYFESTNLSLVANTRTYFNYVLVTSP